MPRTPGSKNKVRAEDNPAPPRKLPTYPCGHRKKDHDKTWPDCPESENRPKSPRKKPAPIVKFKNRTKDNYQNGSFQSSGKGTSAQRIPVDGAVVNVRWRKPKVAAPEANTPEASSPGGLRMDTPSVYTPEPLLQTPPNPRQSAGGHGQYQDRDPFIETSFDAEPGPGPEYSEWFYQLFQTQDGSKPDDLQTIDPRRLLP